MFYPPYNRDGCSHNFNPPVVDSDMVEVVPEVHNMDWKGYVMVDAGNCSYETKARNIEKTGA